MKNRILVSACLLGQPVRYDGKAKTLLHPLLQQWQE
ncbi:purine nucleoside phosphorylase, partial [Gluconobacter japonicus]